MKALLLTLVVLETSLFAGFAGFSYWRVIEYSSFQYGCKDLVASKASNGATVNDTTVRWEQITCPNNHALTGIHWGFGDHTPYPNWAVLIPIFTAPPGLLGLFAVSDLADSCPGPNPSVSWSKGPPLVSGVSIEYPATFMDYCAVVSGSAGMISPFSLQWSAGPYSPYVEPTVLLSAPSVTVARGHNATFTLMMTSLHGFDGNVSFTHIGFVYPSTGPWSGNLWFSQRSLIVRAGGSNSTVVTVQAYQNSPAGTWNVQLYGDAEYRLRFYGDYSGSATSIGSSTVMQITMT